MSQRDLIKSNINHINFPCNLAAFIRLPYSILMTLIPQVTQISYCQQFLLDLMEQKQSMDLNIEAKQEVLNEKDHQWTDEELYPRPGQQLSCWERFKIVTVIFYNKAVDFWQFDRIFFIEGQHKIDLKRCHKRYMDDYSQTYSQRQLRFGYTFDLVLQQKLKEEKRKQKNFTHQLYRLVCCQGGNELNEIQEAYRSQRQFVQLLKKKIMQRKEEYELERNKMQETKQDPFRLSTHNQIGLTTHNQIRLTTHNQILQMQPTAQEHLQIQELFYDEQPVTMKKERKKKPTQKNTVPTQVLQIRPAQNAREKNVFNYESQDIEQKMSGRVQRQVKQSSNPTNNSDGFHLEQVQSDSAQRNQIVQLKGTTSHTILKPIQSPEPNENDSVSVKNIYRENRIKTTTYHENIIITKTVSRTGEQEELIDSPTHNQQSKKMKKGKKMEEQEPEQEDELRNTRKKKKKAKVQTYQSQRNPDQRIHVIQSAEIQHQQLLFVEPNNEEVQIPNQRNSAKKENSFRKQKQAQMQLPSPKREQSQKIKQDQGQSLSLNENQQLQENAVSKKKISRKRPAQELLEEQISAMPNYKATPPQQKIPSKNIQKQVQEQNALKTKKQRKNRNTESNGLIITQTAFQFEETQQISKINLTTNQESDNGAQQTVGAKKSRKLKKSVKNTDLQDSHEIALHNMIGPSTSTQISANRTLRNNQVEFDEEKQAQEIKRAAKKRRNKKQLRENPSEQAFQMVFLDEESPQIQGMRKLRQETGSNIFLAGEIEQNMVKAEKKRKQKVMRKDTQDDFDQLVSIDL